MKEEILSELKSLKDETEIVINNNEQIDYKKFEIYLKNMEKIRYNIFDKIETNNKNVISKDEKIRYLNDEYRATAEGDVLKIYIPEVIPKFKNINNHAYKNILINVTEKTKEYKNMFNRELVFVFIRIVENQKNIDIDNKFVKPIIDGLVSSKVIEDDNISNMFYGVFRTADKIKNPYTEVYVFRGKKFLEWIQKNVEFGS